MTSPGFPPNLFVNVVGPLIISSAFSMLALGVVLTKAFDYFLRSWKQDGWLIKSAVFGCLVGTLLESVGILGWAYLWGSKHWGDPAVFFTLPIFNQLQCFGVGVTTFSTQLFFAWRIFIVQQRSYWVAGVISAATISQLGLAICITVKTIIRPGVEIIVTGLAPDKSRLILVHIWIGLCLAGDILITSTLIWSLAIQPRRHAGSGERLPSLSILNSIALRTLEFNIASLIFQIALTWMTVTTSVAFWFNLPTSIVCKMYSLSVIISLTARTGTRFSNEMNLSQYTLDGETPSKRRQLSSNTFRMDLSGSVEAQRTSVVPPLAVYLNRDTTWDKAHPSDESDLALSQQQNIFSTPTSRM